MIPQTNISEYHEFTHKLIMTSIGTIILSTAITGIVTSYILPFSIQYVPGWALPLLEIAVGAYILFLANRTVKSTPTETPTTEQPQPEVIQSSMRSSEGGQVVYPPPQSIESVFTNKRD